MRTILLTLCAAAGFFSTACKKKTELTSTPIAEYYPLKVGKYIIYRCDSTVPTSNGVVNNGKLVVRSYRMRDIVDAEVTDALGRKAYRIFRSVTDTLGIGPWRQVATLLAVPNGTDWVELNDNNLRFMKLRFPVLENFEWKGNSLFMDDLNQSNLPFGYYAGWVYQYQQVDQKYPVLGKTYDSTVTVFQRSETIPEQRAFDPAFYYQENQSTEVYGKGIGLIYRNFLHTVWQPPTPGGSQGHYEDETYGIKLQIIEHN